MSCVLLQIYGSIFQGLNPEDFGWKREEDAYRPVWYDGSFLPDTFLNEESESVETDEEDDYDENYFEDVQEAEWSDSSEEDD